MVPRMPRSTHGIRPILAVLALLTAGSRSAPAQSFEDELKREGIDGLARQAAARGDPKRGAEVFHRPGLACVQCHARPEAAPASATDSAGAPASAPEPIGPILENLDPELSAPRIVEAILEPSKTIRKGFEPIIVATMDGHLVQGILVEETPDHLVIREVGRPGKPSSVAKAKVESRQAPPQSLMPGGLANQLANKQDLLDLVAYVHEIAQKGPGRARALRPPPMPAPDQEQNIDHAGLIRELGEENFERGAAIYLRTCINCHGTREKPGSLPTSLRFAEGKFKNGADPFSLYRTLTHGFGMMTPQTWMVPTQKYDVIHYIREAYLRPFNPGEYKSVDGAYLAGLPKGTSRGPSPRTIEPWVVADYGPSLAGTYELPIEGRAADGERVLAYKGIAVRVDQGPMELKAGAYPAGGVGAGRAWMVFDHDSLRVAGAWSGAGFIDWNGILFNGRHDVHPRAVGKIAFGNPNAPGWADPNEGRFDDPRLRGRDGIAYGPLPKSWGRYLGSYAHGARTVFHYTLGSTRVLELLGLVNADAPEAPVFVRTLWLSPRETDLTVQVAHRQGAQAITSSAPSARWGEVMTAKLGPLEVALIPPVPGARWRTESGGELRLTLPAGESPIQFSILLTNGDDLTLAIETHDPPDLPSLTHGGPARFPELLQTTIAPVSSPGPFDIQDLTHPTDNPWKCQMRFTGLDFFDGGDQAAVCGWDGDVWLVSGLAIKATGSAPAQLTWRRIASGLFQPLGLKIVNGAIHVACRDQIVILRDLNADVETDYYECFNSDHQVTEHFHEFAMGLETDADGNFYYAKSARHALPALVPHHGTLLKVSADGGHTEILATGFRAANGVCVNPDGTFFVTDQEGHWMPKNRINWVRPGRFYGNMLGYHDVIDRADSAMEPPVCWITNRFDRSPAECLWVPQGTWGPLAGRLLASSYGYGVLHLVLSQRVGDQLQGGMIRLPIPDFPTGIIRGRFHSSDGQLYLAGMYSWAGSRTLPGGLYRVRYTGQPLHLPLELSVAPSTIRLVFSDPLDPDSCARPANYAITIWSLKRTANYGSQHLNERPLSVVAASLAPDGRALALTIPDLVPTMGMEIRYDLKSSTGASVQGMIHNTIHSVPPRDEGAANEALNGPARREGR